MGEVAIFGAGGLGQLVHDILLQAQRERPVAFLDSNPRLAGTTIDQLPVLGGVEQIQRLAKRGIDGLIIAIGASRTRAQLAERCRAASVRLISAIHPLAAIAASAEISEHVIIGARCTICVHARINSHSVLSTGSIIEHDDQIGAGVFLHPAVRLAGGVHVGEFATIGIGSCVIPGRKVGHGAYVAPGSVVIRDVPPHATVGGVPAREFEEMGGRFLSDPLPPFSMVEGMTLPQSESVSHH